MNDTREPVSGPLRRLGASVLTLSRIRLELFAIEAQEEKERIAGVVLWAVFAALVSGFALLMLMLLVVVALWDSYRLLALGVATAVLVAAAAAAAARLKGLLGQPSTLFHSSIGELRQDADALRNRRSDA